MLKTMRPLPRIYRLAAWMGLWALLLPAILPLVHHPAAMAGAAMPMCHMAQGGSQTSDAHKDSPQHGKALPSCPICQSLGTLAQGFLTPEAIAITQSVTASNVTIVPLPAFLAFQNFSPAWPRAPPVPA